MQRTIWLHLYSGLPMNGEEKTLSMQITVTISDAIVREAGSRGLAVTEFVESLIDKGLVVAAEAHERPGLSSAIERIRSLRTTGTNAKV
jgi:hypothetical protein